MAQRKNAQPGFIDELISEFGGPRTRELLERLGNAVPWEQLVKPILKLPEYRNRGAGRPAWSAITMLKSCCWPNGSISRTCNSRSASRIAFPFAASWVCH